MTLSAVVRTLSLAALLALLSAPPALAGSPGQWDPVTSADGVNIDQVGLLRTPDHALHVIWHRKTPGNPAASADLMQTVVSPDGTLGAAQTIATGFAGIGDAAVVRDAAGRIVVVAGATGPRAAPSDFGAWTSTDGGATWALQPGDAAVGGGFSDDVGAAIGPDGATPFFAWGATAGLFVHRGLDAALPAVDLQGAAGFGCCGYSPGLAVDGASGQLTAAWYSNATGHVGVFAQALDGASGAPAGPVRLMPGSATTHQGTAQSSASLAHTPIVARPGQPGTYVAYAGGYPTTRKALVWRTGASGSTTVGTSSTGLRDVGLSATPEGRLWASWSAGSRIYARRSNRAGTVWGATVSTPVKAGTANVFKLAGNAQSGRLDLFGAFSPATGSGVQTWHTQVLAGLTAVATPAKVKTGAARMVKVLVTDAGDPVAGAKVRVGTAKATTGATGRATLKVGPFSSPAKLKLVVTRAGYVEATGAVKVVR